MVEADGFSFGPRTGIRARIYEAFVIFALLLLLVLFFFCLIVSTSSLVQARAQLSHSQLRPSRVKFYLAEVRTKCPSCMPFVILNSHTIFYQLVVSGAFDIADGIRIIPRLASEVIPIIRTISTFIALLELLWGVRSGQERVIKQLYDEIIASQPLQNPAGELRRLRLEREHIQRRVSPFRLNGKFIFCRLIFVIGFDGRVRARLLCNKLTMIWRVKLPNLRRPSIRAGSRLAWLTYH